MTQRRERDEPHAGDGLTGFTMTTWNPIPADASLQAAPLVWCSLEGPQGRRVTMARLNVAKARAVLIPTAAMAQEHPPVADAIALNASRLLAEFDLGQPVALEIQSATTGRLLKDEPTLVIGVEGHATIESQAKPSPKRIAAAQGTVPAQGAPFTAVGTDDAGHLMLIHSVDVSLNALEPLMKRIGLRRVVIFGGVPGDGMGRRYVQPTDRSKAPILAQAFLQGAKTEPAHALTLGNAKLLIERRP